ncbi:hypothetical protein IFM89_002385 [Coptis chinensis]|uniref:Endonuclease/exonuclease/phosphatase domain-containing protein n=1 Tax=Coptis chinensis TaxID=261450 RepID=A0A835IIU5_9MAGN|nr:hypothetical protein IFM89_002385 [Coptis chinensis]
MRCIFWNIRGIGNDKSQNRLSKLINKWDPDILGIAEPKINPQEMSMVFLQSHGLSTKFHHNSRQCQVPNLWLFWKSTISPPNLLHCSQQQLTVEGDFNAYLSDSEKQGGNKPSAVAMNDFRECVSNSHLMEVPSKGFLHTWWNKQRSGTTELGSSYPRTLSIFVLTQKLKRLKGVSRDGAREVYGNIKAKVEGESRILELMQTQFDEGNMTEGFSILLLDQENKVEGLMEQEQRFWRQKSRAKWDNDYDRSTKFFHAQANLNRRESTSRSSKSLSSAGSDSKDSESSEFLESGSKGSGSSSSGSRGFGDNAHGADGSQCSGSVGSDVSDKHVISSRYGGSSGSNGPSFSKD